MSPALAQPTPAPINIRVRAEKRALQALGIRAMLAQALHGRARGFYLGCGFTPAPVDPLVLMVTMAELAAAADSS